MKKSLYVWIISGLLSLALFSVFYERVFPAASVNVNINRQEAYNQSEFFLLSNNFEINSFRKTILFGSDNTASVYLQKKLGIEKANELVLTGLPIWSWRVRYFKELDKEEYRAGIDPSSGKLTFFRHLIMETDPGASLDQSAALLKAESFLLDQQIDIKEYLIKENESVERLNRMDHYFVWEKKDFKIDEATLRVSVGVLGDQIGSYSRYIKVPELFLRELTKEMAPGQVLAKSSHLLMLMMLLWAIYYLMTNIKLSSLDWRKGLIFMAVFVVIRVVVFMNNMGIMWNSYPNTISLSVFFMLAVESLFGSAIGDALIIFSFFILGSIYSARDPFISNNKTNLIEKIIVGYSLAFLFLGYIVIFYFIGTKMFDIWMPLSASYSNVLGTYFPFIGPLALAVTAAISEELSYRMLGVSFLNTVLGKRLVALFIPALFWGFAHSTYQIFPMHVRGVELTIFGIIFGIVYLRYGLGTVVLAHVVIDIILASIPLIKCSDPFISAPVLVLVVAAPLILFIFKDRIKILF